MERGQSVPHPTENRYSYETKVKTPGGVLKCGFQAA
jgi:hypothetical protein